MPNDVNIQDMATLLESIQHAFPQLAMDLNRNHPQPDLSMDIPQQPGNAFDLHINLQGDELHLIRRVGGVS
jgi:hypothetical protein